MSKFAFIRGERLTGVTLKEPDGTVRQKDFPAIHPDLVDDKRPIRTSPEGDTGFSTTHRAHVSREEALQIAKRRRQTVSPKSDTLDTAHLRYDGLTEDKFVVSKKKPPL